MTHFHLPLTPERVLWPLPWAWALLLLLLLPPLWFWWRWRRETGVRFSALFTLRAAATGNARRLRMILPILRTAAMACLIIAIARPQRPDESSRIYAEGIAIQMVVDTSTSMLNTDLSPPGRVQTRLDVVKDVFRRFVTGDDKLPGRQNDLIGMIRFALYPDSVCPLTLDHDALLNVLDNTRTVLWVDDQNRIHGERDEDRTAIGDALGLAVERLKDLKRTSGSGEQYEIKSRIIILLTDGENNAGMIEPEAAGELAARYGIKVYTIMAGVPEQQALIGQIPIDDSELRKIAEITGGKHFRADNYDSLEEVYGEIDRLERTRTEERRYVQWGELGWPWLLAAFICLSTQTLLDATWLRKIP